MKALIQRVSHASVSVSGQTIGAIDTGLLVLLGIEADDSELVADKLLAKLLAYRVFSDSDARMNLSVTDVAGGLLLVSQFTLVADTRKGNRPGFSRAAAPPKAEALYHYFCQRAAEQHSCVETGRFGADMQILLNNDGPVTFLLEVSA